MRIKHWLFGSLLLCSCDLYSNFSRDNERNCLRNSNACGADEVCNPTTARCESSSGSNDDMAMSVDMARPDDLLLPPPPVGFMFAAGSPLGVTAMQISGLAVADLNRDTYPEIVFTDAMANNVVIVRNMSGASFDGGTPKTVGTGPTAPRIADINADTFLDVVNVNTGSNNLTYYTGDGNANLLVRTDIDVMGTAPVDLAVGDVLGDGKPSLLTANSGSNTFSVIRNTGSLAFYGSYPVNSNPYTISLGQFDRSAGAGADVACANRGANQVTVMNNGGLLGLYSILNTYGVQAGAAVFSSLAFDFDNDGQTDIATVVPSQSKIRVCLLNGQSGCRTTVQLQTETNPAYAVVADFDRDGKFDLAVTNRTSKSVSIYINNAGVFSAPLNISTGATTPYWIAAGDFDKDGKNDIVIADQLTSIVVLRNTSS